MQHLDVGGYTLKELVSSSGILQAFHAHVWALLNPWSAGSAHSQKMFTMVSHLCEYVGPGFDRQKCYNKFRAFTLTIGAAIWARMDLKYSAWPWRLLRGVRTSADTTLADAELNAFYNEDKCCLDSWWSLWLRSTLVSRQQLFDDKFQSLLRHLERHCLGTNMGLECLLAQMNSACPSRSSQGRNAERFAYAGALAQWMQRHLARGKEDARKVTYEDLKRAWGALGHPPVRGAVLSQRTPRHGIHLQEVPRVLESAPRQQ